MALREVDGGPGYFSQFANSLPTDPSFFPIGVWFESVTSQADINLDKAAGLNLYVVLTSSSNLSLIQNNGMFAILQADTNEWRTNPAAINNPAVVGWLLSDEIDMQQSNAAGAAAARSELNSIIASLPSDGRFTYSNYGKGVMFWNSDSDAQQFVNDFQGVTSADTYWFTDSDLSDASQGGELLNNGNPLTVAQTRLAANYGYAIDHMRELDAMDGQHQPIWAFVEVGWPFTGAQGVRAIEPAEIQAAVWHSIIAGARGIIYFNHSFGGPEPTQHVLRDPYYAAERAAVTETDALIDQLAPVLNAPFDDAFVTVGPSVRVMAKFYDGGHYVFAGSTQNAASTATFTLADVTSGTATVIDEGRTIPITNGHFSDNFADGNAIHIYQIGPDLSGPATETYIKMYDAFPSATELNTLLGFATNQYDYAVRIGVPSPTLYVYEALGLALSHGPAFVSQYSPGVINSDISFASAAWLDIFGQAPTTELIKFVTDHVDFYEAIYRASGAYGSDPNTIELLARGATYGLIIGSAEQAGIVVNSTDTAAAVSLIGVTDAGQSHHF